MTKKKTNPKATCCTKKGKTSFLILVILLIALFVIFMPNSHEKATVTDRPVVEMISDAIEVFIPEEGILVPPADDIDTPALLNLDSEDPIFTSDSDTTPVTRDFFDETFKYNSTQNEAKRLVRDFFNKYNQKEFKDACEILVDTKCDATSSGSVARLGEELAKMENGYENVDVRYVDVPDFHSNIICVEYDYRYLSSSNPDPVHEVMSFYVQDDKITYRICEAKTRGETTLECPIQARQDFCL